MELLEFIKKNPNIIKTLKNCKTQKELHQVIAENNLYLNNISEIELYNLIKENQQQNEQVEDEILENVAGGSKEERITAYVKNKVDPNTIRFDKKNSITMPMDQALSLINDPDLNIGYDDFFQLPNGKWCIETKKL